MNANPVSYLSFRPKLVESLRGYTRAKFFADALAGCTVGIVALPLAIGFGIASGVSPGAGIYTAIIGGFLVAALGGSRVQIGGPAGAFVGLVYAIIAQYGLPNLLICTAMAGVFLFIRDGSDTPKLASAWLDGRVRDGESLHPQEPQCVGADVSSGVCGEVST
ncbi:MAG: hypothetical protein EXS32_12010, partial [Opitutus sp.]|nr:hypothetical protein [Opitutus sp.]